MTSLTPPQRTTLQHWPRSKDGKRPIRKHVCADSRSMRALSKLGLVYWEGGREWSLTEPGASTSSLIREVYESGAIDSAKVFGTELQCLREQLEMAETRVAELRALLVRYGAIVRSPVQTVLVDEARQA